MTSWECPVKNFDLLLSFRNAFYDVPKINLFHSEKKWSILHKKNCLGFQQYWKTATGDVFERSRQQFNGAVVN